VVEALSCVSRYLCDLDVRIHTYSAVQADSSENIGGAALGVAVKSYRAETGRDGGCRDGCDKGEHGSDMKHGNVSLWFADWMDVMGVICWLWMRAGL
jgi:hypothetical protein